MKKLFSLLSLILLLFIASCGEEEIATTQTPTVAPTQVPTQTPTEAPTQAPTVAPTVAPTQAPTNPPVELTPTTLYMIGDSTCANYDLTKKDLDYYYQRSGFGSFIGDYLSSSVTVKNLAVGGASSRSFLTLPEYSQFTSGIKEGDYVIIGFGHNDEKKIDEKFTTLVNDGTTTEGTFQYYVYNYYVKVALDKGATPILATPIARRDSKGEYAQGSKYLHCMQESADYGGGDYAQSTRDLAAQYNLTLIDNTTMTGDLLRSLGEPEASYLFGWLTSADASIDGTHLNYYGAKKVAYMIADALAKSSSPLAKYVLGDRVAPTKEADLKVNPLYVEPTYKAPTSWSNVWNTTGNWKGSAFGTFKSSKTGMDQFVINENTDGSVTLQDRGNNTRVNTSADSFVMYFQQVNINASFTLTCTMTIDEITTPSNNAACGIMVRDDMYVDQYIAGNVGSYLACGNLGVPFTSGGQTYSYRAFTRLNETLGKEKGDKITDICEQGESVTLKIVKVDSTYSLYYNDQKTTANYDLALSGIDSQYIYVGMFISGTIKVSFSNISMTVIEQ